MKTENSHPTSFDLTIFNWRWWLLLVPVLLAACFLFVTGAIKMFADGLSWTINLIHDGAVRNSHRVLDWVRTGNFK